eukprot:m.238495 g.238495  ORF g.238495 m.238495 type:complete len:638 (-) comp54356_c0_seq2:167-2080(-)
MRTRAWVDSSALLRGSVARMAAVDPWKTIQARTFTNWVNVALAPNTIPDLQTGFADGTNLVLLVQALSGSSVGKYEKAPRRPIQFSQNIDIALQFLQRHEKIKLVNISALDISEGKATLILGLVWTMIVHYDMRGHRHSVVQSAPDAPTEQPAAPTSSLSAKQELLNWCNSCLPEDVVVQNFSKDWTDGRALEELILYLAPTALPADRSSRPVELTRSCMNAANDTMAVPMLLTPEDFVSSQCDEMSRMAYVAGFRNYGLLHNIKPRTKKESTSKAGSSVALVAPPPQDDAANQRGREAEERRVRDAEEQQAREDEARRAKEEEERRIQDEQARRVQEQLEARRLQEEEERAEIERQQKEAEEERQRLEEEEEAHSRLRALALEEEVKQRIEAEMRALKLAEEARVAREEEIAMLRTTLAASTDSHHRRKSQDRTDYLEDEDVAEKLAAKELADRHREQQQKLQERGVSARNGALYIAGQSAPLSLQGATVRRKVERQANGKEASKLYIKLPNSSAGEYVLEVVDSAAEEAVLALERQIANANIINQRWRTRSYKLAKNVLRVCVTDEDGNQQVEKEVTLSPGTTLTPVSLPGREFCIRLLATPNSTACMILEAKSEVQRSQWMASFSAAIAATMPD